jgi:hypothetical protein
MNKALLAVAVLLGGAVSVASADYVIIIVNLGQSKDTGENNGPGGPGGGEPGGIGPGGIGPGGPGGFGGGLPPGAMGGMGGFRGMAGGGMGGFRGMAGGGMGGFRGMAGGGISGGPFPGGFAGGPGLGVLGGIGGGNPDEDVDPYNVFAIVEVQALKAIDISNLNKLGAFKVTHKWGESTVYAVPGSNTKVKIAQQSGKPVPTVSTRFEIEKKKTFDKGGKAPTDRVLELAEFALTHGLLAQFTSTMDKLAEEDKTHPAVVAYLKVKPEIERGPTKEDNSASLRATLLKNYKVATSKHYTLLHTEARNDAPEVQSRLNRLELAFQSLYYWFALKSTDGKALPVPQERLVSVMTPGAEKEFERHHDVLGAGPVVVDGFFAPRENLSVISEKRRDAAFGALDDSTKPLWKDFKEQDILKGRNAGVPRDKLDKNFEIWNAQTMALLKKAMEDDAELASVSHEVTRQLVYSSGLLPRGVEAPEWIQFGMGSFFETPTGSPWVSTALPSYLYLNPFKEMAGLGKGKKKEKDQPEKNAPDTLRRVITNYYFRHADRLKNDPSARQKAQATAWSLTYYLATNKLDGLLRYHKELARMPRDLELDEEVLLGCFARAFDAVDANKKVDQAKLNKLAEDWYRSITGVDLEKPEIFDDIRNTQKELATQPKPGDKPGGGPSTGPQPPGGSGGRPPGGS